MDAAPIPSPQSLEAPPLLSFPKVIPEEAGDALQLPCAVSCSGQLALLHVPYTTSCARAVSCPAWGLSPCPSSSLSAATTSQGRANPACASRTSPRFMGTPDFCSLHPGARRCQPSPGAFSPGRARERPQGRENSRAELRSSRGRASRSRDLSRWERPWLMDEAAMLLKPSRAACGTQGAGTGGTVTATATTTGTATAGTERGHRTGTAGAGTGGDRDTDRDRDRGCWD